MAEFCLDCWNKLMNSNDPAEKYVLSDELDLCEGCGEWKPVIICIKRRHVGADWFRRIIEKKNSGKSHDAR